MIVGKRDISLVRDATNVQAIHNNDVSYKDVLPLADFASPFVRAILVYSMYMYI